MNIAKKKGIAVLVDVAGEVYPLERMSWLPRSGADLVCFGAKHFGSTHSTGVMCGRQELVGAAVLHNFIGFEVQYDEAQARTPLGRVYKVDRQEVIATLVALREWFTLNHEERFMVQERRIQTIAQALAGLPHVGAEHLWERRGPWMRLRVTVDEAALGKTATSIEKALRGGDPSIRVRVDGNQIYMAVHPLREGEDKVVADRLSQLLSG